MTLPQQCFDNYTCLEKRHMDHNQISHLIRHYEDQKFTSYHVDHQSLYLTSYTEPIIETRELKNTELLCT